MANNLNSLPPGFRFTPTAEELLHYYLPRRQMGEFFGLFLVDVDLYANEPWKLLDYDERSLFYVFTGLKRTGKRVQRRVGSGTWMGQNNSEVKDRLGNVIGIDRYFYFKLDKGSDSDDEHGRWTMHEFAPVNERGEVVDHMVVCVIGHDTQICTKPSVSVPKKVKRRMAPPTEEESSVQINGSNPTHYNLIPSEAETSQPYLEFHEGELLACSDDQPSVSVSKKRKGGMASPANEESCLQIDGSEPTHYVLQGNQNSSLVPSEAEASLSYLEFLEGELLACSDDQPSVSVSKERKGGMASPADEESCLQIDGSEPTHYVLQGNQNSSLIPSEAEASLPYLEFLEGELLACSDDQPSVSVSKERIGGMASPADEESCIQIDASEPTDYVLQGNQTSSLVAAEQQQYLEFDEGELWAILNGF